MSGKIKEVTSFQSSNLKDLAKSIDEFSKEHTYDYIEIQYQTYSDCCRNTVCSALIIVREK